MSAICGGRHQITKRKPKNWFDNGYCMIVPYRFKNRITLGKATCDCKEIIEDFQPWYGYTWSHNKDCAIEKHIKKYPGIQNFFSDTDLSIIAQSD